MAGRDGSWCDDNDVDDLFGLSRNARLTERVGADVAPFAASPPPPPPESRGHGTGMFALAAVRRRSRPQLQAFVFCSGRGI